jgi:hypothetical protein
VTRCRSCRRQGAQPAASAGQRRWARRREKTNDSTTLEGLNGENSLKGEVTMSSVEKEEKRISRRDFAKGAAVVGAGVLVSCGPTPQVVKETVEVPVEVEKIVKETVEVPVEVTKIVEKIVEVPAEGCEAGPVTLEVFDPTGAFEVTETFAPRLDTLEGKTICALGSGWESERTFPVILELLQNEYPTAKFIPETETVWTSDQIMDLEFVAQIVKEKGCDAVITGNAG